MKKCPTCDKTFEDSMRFCQVDGTPLVDDEPAFDPYATMMARPEDLAAVKESAAAPVESQPEEAPPISEPEDVLDLPEADPLKTMYVSEEEMKAALAGESRQQEPEIVEIPPISPAPEPPSFNVPDVPPPSFGDMSPPPSPFSSDDKAADEPKPFSFNEAETMYQAPVTPFEPPSKTEEPFSSSPETPSRSEEPSYSSPFETPTRTEEPVLNTPFETPTAAPVAEWTPPPAPDASWQNKEIGANTPFQPPPAGTGGLNQTLPIVSLVLGIISICCYVSPITGLGALITGYLGMKNVNTDPQNYGGKGLAMAGMIIGGLFFLIGTAYYIFVILVYAGLIGASMFQGLV